MKITVLIADDHALMRDGLRAILETDAGIEVLGLAIDGRDAVRQTYPARHWRQSHSKQVVAGAGGRQ